MKTKGVDRKRGTLKIPSMKIGYARVSTDEQNLDLQLQALAAAGCETVFEDQELSGVTAARPGLRAALEGAKEGDTHALSPRFIPVIRFRD